MREYLNVLLLVPVFQSGASSQQFLLHQEVLGAATWLPLMTKRFGEKENTISKSCVENLIQASRPKAIRNAQKKLL